MLCVVIGEFQLRLRHLEKDLLRALNEAKGNILEDNSIIAHLETLKKEAQEVAKKMNETDRVIKEVEQVSSQYDALALYSSAIYFTLESLNQVRCFFFIYYLSLDERIAFCVLFINCIYSVDPLLVSIFAAILPGYLHERASEQPAPERCDRSRRSSLHHHERPLPGCALHPVVPVPYVVLEYSYCTLYSTVMHCRSRTHACVGVCCIRTASRSPFSSRASI